MILLIDNYDSFTYNLYQYLGELDEVKVVRNDTLTIEEIRRLNPSVIVLSPGPGHPQDAGICIEVIRRLGTDIPVLGICLGHQAIGVAFGSVVDRAKRVMHGKTSVLETIDHPVFASFSEPIEVMRYHSLVILPETLSDELQSIAVSSDDKEIMAVQHKQHPIIGLQFHPESIGTTSGKELLAECVRELMQVRQC